MSEETREMARKGTVLTEEQIRWSEISAEAWAAARTAAAAKAANGNPMTDDEIEARARNAQDREDIRRAAWGGNLGANCKNMSRSELVDEINRQLQAGIHGNSKQAFKKVREAREAVEARKEADLLTEHTMPSKYRSTCRRCEHRIEVGETIIWTPKLGIVGCAHCRQSQERSA